MLGREGVEGQQLLAVLFQLLRGLGPLGFVPLDEGVEGDFCVLTVLGGADLLQRSTGSGLG